MERHEQRGRIERISAQHLGVTFQTRAPGALFNVPANLLSVFCELLYWNVVESAQAMHFQQPVESDPAQEPRVRVMLAFVPRLPDPVIRLLPIAADESTKVA